VSGWRVAVVDSGCGLAPPPTAGARFVAHEDGVLRREPEPDALGHGTRVAAIVRAHREVALLDAQVFGARPVTTPAAVAAAIHWAVDEGASLVHLSLGLAHDRPVLAAAVARAVAAGVLLVAAVPARGRPTWPAGYPGVIRATGDARCGPGQVSRLGRGHYGGAVRTGPHGGGASIGAAHVTGAVLATARPGATLDEALAALDAACAFEGPERRGPIQPGS
jgi:hypothetical protein